MKRRMIGTIRQILFYSALSGITCLLLLPAIVALGTSFKPTREIFTRTPSILPKQITLVSYVKLLGVPEFPVYLLNSLVVAGLNAFLVIIAAMLAAYALTFFDFRGRKAISQMILATYMFPAITLAAPMFFLADRLHLLDTYWILILADMSFSLPISIWMLNEFLGRFPMELEKAARVDGCSNLQIIRHVILPIMTPGITAVGAFAFILSWGEYLFSMTLTLTDSYRTVSSGVHSLLGNYRIDYGLLTAASTLIVIPVIVLFAVFEKYIVAGLTAGSLKS